MAPKGLNFTKGVKQIKKIVNPELTMTKEAQSLLVKSVESLNKHLTDEYRRRSSNSTTQDASSQLGVAAQAVSDVFTGGMETHAIAEGNRSVFKYNAGLIEFRAKMTDRQRKKAKSKAKEAKKQMGAKFTTGVNNLCSLFPETSLNSSGRQVLCYFLQDLSQKIVKEAKQVAKEGDITPMDVNTAVKNFFPVNLREHAFAEGTKLIVFLESGRIVFNPLRPKERTRAVPRKKRKSSSSLLDPVAKRTRWESASQSERKPRVSQKKTPRKKPGATRNPKKVPATSTTAKSLQSGVAKLNKHFEQALASDAKGQIGEKLAQLLDRALDEIGSENSSRIGPEEIRNTVLKIFPEELQATAMARLNQVLTILQYE